MRLDTEERARAGVADTARNGRRGAVVAGGLLVLAAAALIAYLPMFRTFVGTDIGVYWEIAERLGQDGRLALGENYWDHKPLLSYLVLSPFRYLATDGMELLGLKIGTLCIYAGSVCLLFLAFMGLEVGGTTPLRRALLVVPGLAALAALVLDVRLDAPNNGVLVVAGLCMEGAGLVFLSAAARDPGRRWCACLAGVLVGTAPFWRPTVVAGLAVLGVLALGAAVRCVRRRSSPMAEPALIAGAAAGLACAGWLALTFALGTPPRVWWETVVELNARYGRYFREITPIGTYFRQDSLALAWFVAATALTGVQLAVDGARAVAARTADPLRRGALPLLYLAVSLGLAVAGRKVQNFYPLQFVLPACLVCLYLLATGPVMARGVARTVCAGGLGVLAAWSLYASLSAVPPVIWRNSPASNRNMDTGVIAQRLASHPRGAGPGARLWVLGNRANLYQQARLRGIGRYDWTVFDLALLACNDATFDRWVARFRADPPEFIVRVSNAQAAPWELAERTAARVGAVNALVESRYDRLERPAATESGWPYGYEYTLLALKPRGETGPGTGGSDGKTP